jgi:hypothetical protein
MTNVAVNSRSEAQQYFDYCSDEIKKKTYLKEIVPSMNKTVGELAAILSSDTAWMHRAFMDRGPVTKDMQGRLARHIHEQCIILEVPFYLFKEGCVFFGGLTPKYWGVWAVSVLRQQAMRKGFPLITNDFKVRYDIPTIKDILAKQDEYIRDMTSGKQALYASMSLRDVMGEERTGCFRFKRGELVIFGAEVTFYIDGTPQNPVYFGVDFSKTSVDLKKPFGAYQQQVVRTKAIRHAMQTYYGPLLPEVQTVDEAANGDITGDEDAESAMRHYDLAEAFKASRKAEILG